MVPAVPGRPLRIGLPTGDFRGRGGLLLCGMVPRFFDGLMSPSGLMGVLPYSANFQNGAGELVGMCWLGRWAVLGGARRGCSLRGAGVTRDKPSSLLYDDVRTGDRGVALSRVFEAADGWRWRGKGLWSPTSAVSSDWRRRLRSGVMCDMRKAVRGCGEPEGETLRLRSVLGSLTAMSLGPWVM